MSNEDKELTMPAEVARAGRVPSWQRGRFIFSERNDGPLLELIRNATFVTHAQLVQLAVPGIAAYRQILDWRIRRYPASGLVAKLPPIPPYPTAVYTITRKGLAVLESYSDGLMSINSDSKHLAGVAQAAHFIELTNLRIALRLDPEIGMISWRTDREISSMNYTIDIPYVKDYDAIVELSAVGKRRIKFAIEYERTYKTLDRYEEIARTVARETQLDFVLYVASSPDMVIKLAALLTAHCAHVYVTSLGIFKKQPTDSLLAFSRNGNLSGIKLRDLLCSSHATCRAAQDGSG